MMTTLKNMVEAAKRGRWIVPGTPALSTAACGRSGPDTVAASGAGRLQLWIRLEAVDAVTDEVVDGLLTRFIEVLLLTDPVDALSVSFDGKPFKSLSQGDVDFGEVERPKDAESAGTAAVDAVVTIAAIKGALGDRVSDVRASNRLVDSATCLVAGGQTYLLMKTMSQKCQKLTHAPCEGVRLTRRLTKVDPVRIGCWLATRHAASATAQSTLPLSEQIVPLSVGKWGEMI
jgi:hypothetical protein